MKAEDIQSSIDKLKKILIEDLSDCQRIRFLPKLARIKKSRDKALIKEKRLSRIEKDITNQLELVEKRKKRLGEKINFDESLPVFEKINEIKENIARHQVVIVSGETGSGKTTQLPKICLDMQRGVFGRIACTQPRRIAALNISEFLVKDLDWEQGKDIGYQIRFDHRISDTALVSVMTDGVLLNLVKNDPLLLAFDTIILDEAHERSINIDFLLAYLKTILPKRRDLKIIITSATIDSEKFSAHFHNAPVVSVSGRSFPIEYRYRPLTRDHADLLELTAEVISEIFEQSKIGDVLIFLSGEKEINDTVSHLKKLYGEEHYSFLPLYARLGSKNQKEVFKRSKKRKIICSTNVAETSLTIPGILFVIDLGLVRMSRYHARRKIQALRVEKASRSSLDQRAGRCGRVAPGVCFRLYSEADYAERPRFSDPEILRASLTSVVLRLKQLKVDEIEEFPLIDRPGTRHVKEAIRQLKLLGGLDKEEALTGIGKLMAQFPLDPSFSRILVEAKEHCLHEALVITSFLSASDPRERPPGEKKKAALMHKRFEHKDSDFISYLNLWNYFNELRKRAKSRKEFRNNLEKNLLSPRRMNEVASLYQHLKSYCLDLGFKLSETEPRYDVLHKVLFTGLIGNIIKYYKKGEFLAAANTQVSIHPESVLSGKRPEWFFSSGIIGTSKNYASVNALISKRIIFSVAKKHLEYSYFDPHWSEKKGAVMIYRRSVLFGLVVDEKYREYCYKIDRDKAREIFINKAFTSCNYDFNWDFHGKNKDFLQKLEDSLKKLRVNRALLSEETLNDFFEKNIPEHINDVRNFNQWWKKARLTEPDLLSLSLDKLVHELPPDLSDNFPDKIQVNELDFSLKYSFKPEKPAADGIFLDLSIENMIFANERDFLVRIPGLLKNRVMFICRELPRSLRKNLVPVPKTAEAFESFYRNSFETDFNFNLLNFFRDYADLKLNPELLTAIKLPTYLKLCFRLKDKKGAFLEESRELAFLKDKYSSHLERRLRQEEKSFPVFKLNDGFPKEEIKSSYLITNYLQQKIKVFSALFVDQKTSVLKIRLFSGQLGAHKSQRRALREIFKAKTQKQYLLYLESLKIRDDIDLVLYDIGSNDLKEAILDAAWDHSFGIDKMIFYDFKNFELRKAQGSPLLDKNVRFFAALVSDMLIKHENLILKMNSLAGRKQLKSTLDDISNSLKRIFFPGFLLHFSKENLENYPRYLDSYRLRLEKAEHQYLKDQEKMQHLTLFYSLLAEEIELRKLSKIKDFRDLEDFNWLLEEYRVSLFSQELGTKGKISEKRLNKEWQSLIEKRNQRGQ